MPPLSKPSGAPATALTYITVGALMTVWSSVWWFTRPPHSTIATTVDLGLFLTGLVLLAIGFAVGQIGRSARAVELPPTSTANMAGPDERMAVQAYNGQGGIPMQSPAPGTVGPQPIPAVATAPQVYQTGP
jgi:hypothetical protein